jgi:peptidyl-prolyl cis-trans isomerase D
MWDFINNHKKLIQVLLGIMFLPFAFFGIDHYFRSGDRAGHVATVGGQPISQLEFSQALRERQETVQRMTGGRIDPAALDSPELRFGVLDGLIRQRVMVNRAVRSGIVISDQQLHELISEQPIFHDNGKFSNTRYEEILRRQSMSPLAFEGGLRRDLILERLADAYRSSAIVPNVLAERVLRINGQQREVAQAVIEPSKFAGEVKLEARAAEQYYETHQSEFQIPERARVDYVVLSLDGVAAEQQVTAEEIRQAYEQNPAQYAKGEERQASHILINRSSRTRLRSRSSPRNIRRIPARPSVAATSAFLPAAQW